MFKVSVTVNEGVVVTPELNVTFSVSEGYIEGEAVTDDVKVVLRVSVTVTG